MLHSSAAVQIDIMACLLCYTPPSCHTLTWEVAILGSMKLHPSLLLHQGSHSGLLMLLLALPAQSQTHHYSGCYAGQTPSSLPARIKQASRKLEGLKAVS